MELVSRIFDSLHSLVEEGGLSRLRFMSLRLVILLSLQNFILNNLFVHVCVLFVTT